MKHIADNQWLNGGLFSVASDCLGTSTAKAVVMLQILRGIIDLGLVVIKYHLKGRTEVCDKNDKCKEYIHSHPFGNELKDHILTV